MSARALIDRDLPRMAKTIMTQVLGHTRGTRNQRCHFSPGHGWSRYDLHPTTAWPLLNYEPRWERGQVIHRYHPRTGSGTPRWQCWVEFADIYPVAITGMKIGTPQALGAAKEVRTSLDSIRNGSSAPITRTLTAGRQLEREKSSSFGVAASIEWRNQVSASGGMFGANVGFESELTAKIESHYDSSNRTLQVLESAHETEITCPPMTHLNVMLQTKTKRVKQVSEITGELNCSVRCFSRDQFDLKFDSLDDMRQMLQGFCANRYGHVSKHWSDLNKRMYVTRLKSLAMIPKLKITVRVETEGDASDVADIVATETKL